MRRLQHLFRLVLLAALATTGAAHAQQPTIEYDHVDALGSVRAITDQSGAVVRTHHYHPFGEGVGVESGTDPMRFTGKPRDAGTGLDYFGARYTRSASADSRAWTPSWIRKARLSIRNDGIGTRTH